MRGGGTAEVFRAARGFDSSPLYRHLLAVVADEPALVELASRTRPGQQPTFALFGAVHQLLLGGVVDPLAAYYPSVVGGRARPVDADTGRAFTRFCRTHADRIAAILATRLVQTNHVQRSLVTRLGLALLRRATAAPVCVVEVGCSAGLNLRADRYAFSVGDSTVGVGDSTVGVGDSAVGVGVGVGDSTVGDSVSGGRWSARGGSRVHIRADVPDGRLLPDLDRLPVVADVVGVDLDPPDLTDPEDRAWLRALVWPENAHQAALLAEAMRMVADDPPRVVRGDVADIGAEVAASLPAGLPRLVVHTATRIHVPVDRRPAFDAGVAAFAADGPMLHLALEEDHRVAPSGRAGIGLTATDAAGSRRIAVADGHLAWLEPLPELGTPITLGAQK
ncbi:DUF2332 domain-containing protein [Micromonospora gifhornensis]|uniref:DUF2332 domain-containing protein n=1 Tax=Micromonospora gifhornensis TaxID=84594 RepID=UPI001952B81A|nr:DUF2332 domain-containing protein [Micromonospora gifhornensis]